MNVAMKEFRGDGMRRIMWWLGGALIVVALAIQLVPYGRCHTNPPVTQEPQWDQPNGRMSGYATPDGDRLFYTFQGQVMTRPGGAGKPVTTVDGTWVAMGGTGKWDHRVAHGTFKDTVVAPWSTVSDWTGTWEPKK